MNKKIHMAASNNMVLFLAVCELWANSYGNTKIIKGFDPLTMSKILNLKNPIESILKKDVAFIESAGKPVMEMYHQVTIALENILVAAQKGDAAFFEGLITMQNAYHNGEIEMYATLEEANQKVKEKEVANVTAQIKSLREMEVSNV